MQASFTPRYNAAVTAALPATDIQPATGPTVSTLDRDLFCYACGYNLRGLASNGSCPECAASIVPSLAGDTLAAADARWIRKLRVGIVLLLAAPLVAVMPALMVRGRVLIVIAGLLSPETYRLLLVEEMFAPNLLAGLLPAGSVLTAAAVWRLTPRWPWARHDPRAQRIGLRLLAVLAGAAAIGLYLARWRSFTSISFSAGTVMLSVTTLDVLQAGLLLHYLGALARRSRDARLPARFTLLCILAIARTAVIFIGLCIFYWRSSAYFPVFVVMVIASLDAAPLLAAVQVAALVRLWRATQRWTA